MTRELGRFSEGGLDCLARNLRSHFWIMLLVIIIGTMSLGSELAGILRCVIYRVPFGRPFRIPIFAQVTLPILLIAIFSIFHRTNQDIEPMGPSLSRSLDFLGFMFWLLLLTTFVAGVFGLTRFYISPTANDEDQNAEFVAPNRSIGPTLNSTSSARGPEDW